MIEATKRPWWTAPFSDGYDIVTPDGDLVATVQTMGLQKVQLNI